MSVRRQKNAELINCHLARSPAHPQHGLNLGLWRSVCRHKSRILLRWTQTRVCCTGAAHGQITRNSAGAKVPDRIVHAGAHACEGHMRVEPAQTGGGARWRGARQFVSSSASLEPKAGELPSSAAAATSANHRPHSAAASSNSNASACRAAALRAAGPLS